MYAMLLLEKIDELEHEIIGSRDTRLLWALRDNMRRLERDLLDTVVCLARWPDLPVRRDGPWHLTLSDDLKLHASFIPLRPGSLILGSGESIFVTRLNHAWDKAREKDVSTTVDISSLNSNQTKDNNT
jgi:hypothetical protein